MSILTLKDYPVPPGEIKYWGIPHHGLCTNGVLALPNGASMDYTQPVGGSTWIVKNPRHASLPENPRPLAQYDAAQGFSWLTYLILAGSNRQLAGQNIGVFNTIWVDDNDRAWVVGLTIFSGDYRVILRRRFGLFGEDSISALTDVVIYDGDLGYPDVEHLAPNDFCPNWNGSSILCNMRINAIQPNDKSLPFLNRVVELQLSGAVNNINGGGVGFSFIQEIARGSVLTYVEQSSYDTGDTTTASCGLTIAQKEIIPDGSPPAVCGVGSIGIGVWTGSGSLSTNNASSNKSRDYGTAYEITVAYKVIYGHDNQKLTFMHRVRTTSDTSITSSCSASLSASYNTITSVADDGDGCSSYAHYQKTSTVSGSYYGIVTSTHTEKTERSLEVNGQAFVSFIATYETNSESEIIGSESGTASLSWTEPDTIPDNEVDDRVMGLMGLPLNSPVGVGNQTTTSSSTSSSTAVFDGEDNAQPGETYIAYFRDRAHGLVEYANRIFGYRIGDGTLTVDNHPYEGIYGLVADDVKVMGGRLPDETLTATLDPVSGNCEVSFNQSPICYV